MSSNMGIGSGGLERYKKKNLSIHRDGSAEQKIPKMKLPRELFDGTSIDVNHSVFRERQIKKSRNPSVEKSIPSDWYRKTARYADEEMIVAPIYSLFIPGSPQVRETKGQWGMKNYAYKGIKGCSFVRSDDLGSGNLKGVARCALFAHLVGYSDRKGDNALKDEHGRMVLIDYESRFPKNVDWNRFFSNPLFDFKEFVGGDEEGLQKLQDTQQFHQEMQNAMLLLAVFPHQLLVAPINVRKEAIDFDGRNPAHAFGASQAEFVKALAHTPSHWKRAVQELIQGKNDEEIADQLIEELAHSSILREMNPGELRNGLRENLVHLRKTLQ